MHDKALWFRYFAERSGIKRGSKRARRRPGAAPAPEPHRWHRAGRPSVLGLLRSGIPR